MDFSDYGTIAEIFSAFAIVITLIYGIAQIRINNKLMRVQMTMQAGMGLHEFNREVGKSQQASAVWRRGLEGVENLGEEEYAQFTMLCSSAFNGIELQHRLQVDGMLAKELFKRGKNQIRFLTRRPGVQAWWPLTRGSFNADFTTFVDEIIDEANTDQIKD